MQLCIVNIVRASLNYVNWKERKRVAADLKTIYRAVNERQAAQEVESCAVGSKYHLASSAERTGTGVTSFLDFATEGRGMIYTTNAVESLHMRLRKIIKTRDSFPSEESAMKLLYRALRNASAKWEVVQHCMQAVNHFKTLWGDRIRQIRSGLTCPALRYRICCWPAPITAAKRPAKNLKKGAFSKWGLCPQTAEILRITARIRWMLGRAAIDPGESWPPSRRSGASPQILTRRPDATRIAGPRHQPAGMFTQKS